MEFQITFHSAEDAIRGKDYMEKMPDLQVDHINNKLYVKLYVKGMTGNPTYFNNLWYFEFTRPIKIDPVLRVAKNGNYTPFLASKEFADREIVVTSTTGRKNKTFPVHRIVLANGSTFFRALFGKRWRSNDTTRVEIEADVDDFAAVLNVLYGEGIVLRGAAGLAFLNLVDYFGLVDIDIPSYIAAMDAPPAEELLEYLTLLRERYPNDDTIPKQIMTSLDYAMDEYIDDENLGAEFFATVWHLLPAKIQKHTYLLESER